MKIKKVLIVSALAVALLVCGKREPRHLVILPDVSGSIDRESLEQAFKAIDELASHLQRGDRLTIIPILGDAEAEVSGRVLRFEVPANRQAYDTDLHDFRSKLNVSLKDMQANAVAHPGTRTDIIGSIQLAAQEFETRPGIKDRILLILSDFIQDYPDLDFRIDNHLTNNIVAKQFARKMAKAHPLDLAQTVVYLGLLRSNEYSDLNKQRRDAVQSFWIEYFRKLNGKIQFVLDGIGLIQSALRDD